jgi:hypothetical protein
MVKIEIILMLFIILKSTPFLDAFVSMFLQEQST